MADHERGEVFGFWCVWPEWEQFHAAEEMPDAWDDPPATTTPLVRRSDYLDVHGDLQRAVELVERQNATLNDAADQIEQLGAALNTALESLDQIGMMTKKGRASLHARSTTTFIRAMEGYGNDG